MQQELKTFFRDRDDVETAYLFGSMARGEEGPTSDVDVAIVFDPERVSDGADRRERQLELAADLVDALDRNDVDVVQLDQCSPLFAHRIVRDGVVVKDAAPKRRVAREERIIHRYVDTKPLRDAQWRIARDRIRREG